MSDLNLSKYMYVVHICRASFLFYFITNDANITIVKKKREVDLDMKKNYYLDLKYSMI